MTCFHHLALVLVVAMLGSCSEISLQRGGTTTPASQKPRVIVTTDPELDDSNSLVRYLLYSADFRTEGLIYASSGVHLKGDGKGTKWFVPGREYTRFGLNLCPCESWRWAKGERFIDDAVETYEKVYPNLKVHHPDYPSPAELKSTIRVGNVEFDGDISEDSPGSDLIKFLLLDENSDPLYLLAWGGQSTIARALKSIQDQHEGTPQWPAIRNKVSRIEEVFKSLWLPYLEGLEKYPEYDIDSENACSSCTSLVGLTMEKLKALGEYEKNQGVIIFMGSNKQIPEGLGPHKVILFGDCLKMHRSKGVFAAGCPPLEPHPLWAIVDREDHTEMDPYF